MVGVPVSNRICHSVSKRKGATILSDAYNEELEVCDCDLNANSARYQLVQVKIDSGAGYIHMRARTGSGRTVIKGNHWRRNKYVRKDKLSKATGFRIELRDSIKRKDKEKIRISVWFSDDEIDDNVLNTEIPNKSNYKIDRIEPKINLVP